MTDRGNCMKKIICIGREYGSGGREIGEKLASALKVPCYDKLLIKNAALESGLSEEYIARTEESPIKNFQFLSGNLYADMAVMNNTFYLESQRFGYKFPMLAVLLLLPVHIHTYKKTKQRNRIML